MEVDYRWTSRVPMFGPFHWSIVGFFPLLFATRMSKWTLIALMLYAVFLWLAQHKKFGPIEYLGYLWIRFVYGFKWEVR